MDKNWEEIKRTIDYVLYMDDDNDFKIEDLVTGESMRFALYDDVPQLEIITNTMFKITDRYIQ